MTLCAWGRCRRDRINPEVESPPERWKLPQEGRFCQAHTEQITKTQAGRRASRERRVGIYRARLVAQAMPGYEAALARWQYIADVLSMADSGDQPQHAIYLQAASYLDRLKPKKPE